MGSLILRVASCLDAFSTYPCHTYLPSDAPGGTTGTPAVCPSRSSRTKDRSSQTSYAHDGYGSKCLTTFCTQLALRFTGRTAIHIDQSTYPCCTLPTLLHTISPQMRQ